MNKAVTDGIDFTLPAFELGLENWSSQDGTPGQDDYANEANAAFVPADGDFSGALELIKDQAGTQRLRAFKQTPLQPGCYLKVTARLKVLSGAFPQVRIAGFAATSAGAAVPDVVVSGAALTPDTYGEIYEVSALVGQGNRSGVDMVWGPDAAYGHFGLDLIGATGGVVRIDDLEVEDITTYFLRDMYDVVDVRDYGAIGDGVADDSTAFEAADAAADGLTVLVSEGTYFLGRDVTLANKARFVGTISQAPEHRFVMRRSFDLPSYADAFDDEVEGFKKGYQALLNNSDHEVFDLGGRQIQVTAPMDLHAIVGNRDTFEIRRVIANGMFEAKPSTDWDTVTVSSSADYAVNDPLQLSNVTNVANIEIGSRIVADGVGREVYVRDRNISAGTLTLNLPLHGVATTQTYSFERYQYILDFSGFDKVSKYVFHNIEFQCAGQASGIMIARDGSTFELNDCLINKPKDRAITSAGRGCQDMLVDRCQFLSNEQSLPVTSRKTLVLNVNANDAKIRDCRVMRFEHFAVLAGTGNLLTGNHWFNGDDVVGGARKAGLILTTPNSVSTVSGNYIDNNFIELTNEHDPAPEFSSEFSFGGLTLTGNIFTTLRAGPEFCWLVITPRGAGHFVHGLTVTGNVFRAINGNVRRFERIDTTHADIEYNRMRNIVIDANTFNNVEEVTQNPVILRHAQNTDATTWVVDTGSYMPFGGWARTVPSLVKESAVTAGGSERFEFPVVGVESGVTKTEVHLRWGAACQGDVAVTVRCDTPV
ncbi:MAG: glycosyl hydrolase family 28-related protein [Pseudomonadota bacterium]